MCKCGGIMVRTKWPACLLLCTNCGRLIRRIVTRYGIAELDVWPSRRYGQKPA